jgi:uncharacterized membrane protein (DUF2068 family)
MLRLIAAIKFMKVALLMVVAAGAAAAADDGARRVVFGVLRGLHVDADGRYIHRVVAGAAGLRPQQLRQISFAAVFYAGLFALEGVGLWYARRWAEYVTIVSTATLLPLEGIELFRGITSPRLTALLVNLAIVA